VFAHAQQATLSLFEVFSRDGERRDGMFSSVWSGDRLRRPIWWLPKEKNRRRTISLAYYAIWRYAKWRITWLSEKILGFVN